MVCKKAQGDSEVACYTHSGELPAIWDSFIPEGHFLKKEAIAITEQIQLPDVGFLYILITKNGAPQAAAYFQVLGLKDKHVNSEKVSSMQAFLWKTFTAVAKPKILVAGHLFRHDVPSYYWQPELSAFEAYQYYQQAITAALDKSCANAALVKDTPEALTTYFQHYAPQYLLLRNDISMEMAIPAEWHSMHEYEKALKHKYAQRYRKVRNAFAPLEIKELNAQEVTAQKDEIYKLYLGVTEQQQVRMGFLNKDFLPMLKAKYDNLKVWGVYEAGKMIAFLSAWVKEDAFDMFYIGFDYSKNNTYQLYFNILFFAIEQAIANNKPKLILGRTALEAKARLGCKPHYLSTFLYIRNGFIRNRVLQIQQHTFAQEGAWEERHPLK
jgi:hypothetical protein